MRKTLLLSLLLLQFFSSRAQSANSSGCGPPIAQIDLDISNVQARLLTGGDMWHSASAYNPRYEIPKGSGKMYLFGGAFWIGGLDASSGGLKLAAQTYRQTGYDFWPGPVDSANVGACSSFDRFWKINRQDVMNFISGGAATADMISYPGQYAPYFDKNSDGVYNSADGDYPYFDFISSASGCNECNRLHGDQAVWWVINDVGDIHTSSSCSGAMGIEIQCQAFAFLSSDADINNATFYEYKLVNHNPSTTLNKMMIGWWTDPDLGYNLDSYVGCDVGRGMGYCYNGSSIDAAIGVDFVKGPFADFGDGVDNDRDSCIDCTWVINSSGIKTSVPDNVLPERIKMSSFMDFDNDATFHGNPYTCTDYYNYLTSFWKNSSHVTYGGNGYGGGTGTTTDATNFMFPGDSDPNHWGTNGKPEAFWDEISAGNAPGDRRMVMTAGSFTLQPGAVQCFSIAVPWAYDNSSQWASLAKLKLVDDKLQALADSCFNIKTFTGIKPISNSVTAIYPNPVTSILHMQFALPLKDASLILYDVTGRKAKEFDKLSGYSVQISLQDLPAGIYLYQLKISSEQVMTGKITKQ